MVGSIYATTYSIFIPSIIYSHCRRTLFLALYVGNGFTFSLRRIFVASKPPPLWLQTSLLQFCVSILDLQTLCRSAPRYHPLTLFLFSLWPPLACGKPQSFLLLLLSSYVFSEGTSLIVSPSFLTYFSLLKILPNRISTFSKFKDDAVAVAAASGNIASIFPEILFYTTMGKKNSAQGLSRSTINSIAIHRLTKTNRPSTKMTKTTHMEHQKRC